MEYLYGEFSDAQIKSSVNHMHNEIHKLLLYKDPNFKERVFESESNFISSFNNMLVRYGGLNHILGEPEYMVEFMSVLQAAFDEASNESFRFNTFRKCILDAHGYLSKAFAEVK